MRKIFFSPTQTRKKVRRKKFELNTNSRQKRKMTSRNTTTASAFNYEVTGWHVWSRFGREKKAFESLKHIFSQWQEKMSRCVCAKSATMALKSASRHRTPKHSQDFHGGAVEHQQILKSHFLLGIIGKQLNNAYNLRARLNLACFLPCNECAAICEILVRKCFWVRCCSHVCGVVGDEVARRGNDRKVTKNHFIILKLRSFELPE